MFLNTLSPKDGAKKKRKRVGRGIGSGLGKTAGRGHKGQKSRSGGKVRPGFEGGQMSLKQRLPKFGFKSRKSLVTCEVVLNDLNRMDDDIVTLDTLKKASIIPSRMKYAKVILSGSINKKLIVKGIRVTKGAREAIEAAGGSIEI